MTSKKKNTKKRINNKKRPKISGTTNKKLAVIILGGVLNILACIAIVFIALSLKDTSERLSNYRDLQDKQIASVKELCFDIGNSNSIIHGTYSQDRMDMSLIIGIAKDEYSKLYESTFDNICYKPLLLIAGDVSKEGGSIEEKAKALLEDKTTGSPADNVNNSKYTVIDSAFDAVRW